MENRISKNPLATSLLAITCFILGWYWLPFLFIALAFLFRLKDLYESKAIIKFSFNIIFCVTFGIVSIKILESNFTWLTFAQAITLSLAFIIFGILDLKLPNRFNYFNIILFWLSCQYLFIKMIPDQSLFFLPDAHAIPINWMRWNTYTGYLGGSLWILTINLFAYRSFLRQGGINWLQVLFLMVFIMVPILISTTMYGIALSSKDMIHLYTANESASKEYSSIGELIPRTAMWISVLIIIFTFVKAKTTKTK